MNASYETRITTKTVRSIKLGSALLSVCLLTWGCGLASGNSTSTITITNEMTACSWTAEINGVQAAVAAGSTAQFSVTSSSAIVFTVTATAGACSIGATDSGTNSSAVSNGTCTLNASPATTATLTLEPSSGIAVSSSQANNTTLACP